MVGIEDISRTAHELDLMPVVAVTNLVSVIGLNLVLHIFLFASVLDESPYKIFLRYLLKRDRQIKAIVLYGVYNIIVNRFILIHKSYNKIVYYFSNILIYIII